MDNPRRPRFRWWMPQLALFGIAILLLVLAASEAAAGSTPVRDAGWWALTLSLHLPFAVIVLFVVGGLVERIGYFWKGRAAEDSGRLPDVLPAVTVQLPMFNEHAVAQRVIEAAAALDWPRDRLDVQVLDDSTDADTRALVESTAARASATTGVRVTVHHRTERNGYKAGALEEGRTETDAEFLAIFDADFLPPRDFLQRAVPHFYLADGRSDVGLALVQAQWGHLNHDESALTRAQSLWVDDHHTLQMSWRSAMWQFVNFTGTAGVWRASAIEAAGGWRAASLVEDGELSFRQLFAGFRTKFVKEIVAPAELPATYTAYKAQQKRWTQGWVQVQRLHLGTLLFRFRSSLPRRLHLLYHMCIGWQWPAWAIWITILPFMMLTGHWLGSLHPAVGLLVYLLPSALWIAVTATAASAQTRHTYPGAITPSVVLGRLRRVVPYLAISTGMLPHQVSAFAEGLFGPMHAEFERTPKAASVTNGSDADGSSRASMPTARRADRVRVHWPYVLSEAAFIAYQAAWIALFAAHGMWWAALGAAYLGGCVLALLVRYGDHAGRVLFVIPRSRPVAGAAAVAPPPARSAQPVRRARIRVSTDLDAA
jgi:cellulose synthase/poly-beta-1,6-N-acetylglucosamine synthase-like glycosyltransferase